jgi:hypothetical protein
MLSAQRHDVLGIFVAEVLVGDVVNFDLPRPKAYKTAPTMRSKRNLSHLLPVLCCQIFWIWHFAQNHRNQKSAAVCHEIRRWRKWFPQVHLKPLNPTLATGRTTPR